MPARVSACLLAFLLLAPFARPQEEAGGDTLVVLPFENRAQAPGLEWIGEAFPEVLSERLASPALFAVPRESREYAFERVGVPSSAKVSRATLYRIAEQMDVDQVVVGWFAYDGSTFRRIRSCSICGRCASLPRSSRVDRFPRSSTS